MNAPEQTEDELHYKMDAEQRVFVVHHGRTVGKSLWNAEMLRRLLEAESIARNTARPVRGLFLVIDELATFPPDVWDKLRALGQLDGVVVSENVPTRTLERLTLKVDPVKIGFPRERAQWKQEMNLHPAQRKVFAARQKASRTYRGRGG
jgi:hypothetical protein